MLQDLSELWSEFGYSLPATYSKNETVLSLTLAEKKQWNEVVNSQLFRKAMMVHNQMKPSIFSKASDGEVRNQLMGWELSRGAFLTLGVVIRKKKRKKIEENYQEPD